MSSGYQYLVKVDLEAIRCNLSGRWGRPVSERELMDFLSQTGFRRVADGWVTRKNPFTYFDGGELISAEPVEAWSWNAAS